jgi:hypothetical protein
MSFGEPWRSSNGLETKTIYKRKFALLPVTCFDGCKVWLDYYYTKYSILGIKGFPPEGEIYEHKDKIEDINQEEYVVRRLKEGF